MDTKIKAKSAHSPSISKRLMRDSLLFAAGAVGYYSIEVLFRGYSHWSMALCGGICLLSIFHLNKRLIKRRIFLRALAGAGVITAVELICGCIVNLVCRWDVWDYSHLPLNLWGQICLPFTALWFGLCLPICSICGRFCKKTSM